MAEYLHTGHPGPLTLDEGTSIQRIADALAGAGLECVRLDDVNAAAIGHALAKHGRNRTHAARELGISVRTLQRYLKRAAT